MVIITPLPEVLLTAFELLEFEMANGVEPVPKRGVPKTLRHVERSSGEMTSMLESLLNNQLNPNACLFRALKTRSGSRGVG